MNVIMRMINSYFANIQIVQYSNLYIYKINITFIYEVS